jgi:hypothetical protein
VSQQDLFEKCELTIEDETHLPKPGGGNMHIPLDRARPLILNWGGGVDSTAIAFKLREQKIDPDLVMFSDTGSEKDATYEWISAFTTVMEDWGWDVVRVQYTPARANYSTLLENCLLNRTLPSLAFGYGKCSLKFKGDVMDSWIKGVSRGPNKKAAWVPYVTAKVQGSKVTKLIGYDNGPIDARRSIDVHECADFYYRYPLREEWKLDREGCMKLIRANGFDVPPKSSCTFCPAMKPQELMELYRDEPHHLLMALYVEAYAMPGLTEIEGLWRKTRKGDGLPGSWLLWAEQKGLIDPPEWKEVTKPFREGEVPRTFQEIQAIYFHEMSPRLEDAENWVVHRLGEIFRIEAQARQATLKALADKITR